MEKWIRKFLVSNLSIMLDVFIAKAWLLFYKTKNRVFELKQKYLNTLLIILIATLLCGSIFSVPFIEGSLNRYFLDTKHFSELKGLFLGLGAALLGATAIAFSLIMFAMQINVEKMPYGLFRKFSSDIILLSTFIINFLLSITIAMCSLVPFYTWSTKAIILVCWSIFIVVFLFLVAYRRALKLISPAYQLVLVVEDINKNLISWDKAATRVFPLIKIENQDDFQHNLARVIYFKQQKNWAYFVQQGIVYCNSYARRYAEQGDYEISNLSLNSIVVMNSAYIRTKGKTFFSITPFVDNPESVDGVINETLEHIRQNIRIGLSRSDEQFLELNFRAIYSLVGLYYNIDYSNDRASKYHAHLASGYLSSAIEDCIPHDMPDVLMEGIRLLGNVALFEIGYGDGEHINNITNKIALVSSVGIINKKLAPAAQIGVEQLVKISLELLKSNYHEIGHIAEKLRENVNFIAQNYLKSQSNNPPNIFHHPLSAYYSGTLQSELTNLTNAILASESDNADAKRIIGHVVEWSDGLHRNEKELLLEAIRYKSHFTHDMIQWIADITKLLLAISNSDACKEHEREKLRNNAHWLISVFSWIPDDEATISLVENYSLSNYMFESAMDANNRELLDIATDIGELLLSLAFKIGKHEKRWRNFQKVISKYIVLNIILDRDNLEMIRSIKKALLNDDAPSGEVRTLVAKELSDTVFGDYREYYASSSIEIIMKKLDQEQLKNKFKIVSALMNLDTTQK